jgi:MFS family permease
VLKHCLFLGIEVLFVVGYASSLFAGPLVGIGADLYGRRLFTIVYFLLYAAACTVIHVRWHWVLVLGRVCSGVATSLLYSTFDAWLVKENSQHGFSAEALGDTFRIAGAQNL